MQKKTYNAMAWGSVIVAGIAAIFFPGSRTAGIIALITWLAIIIYRHPLHRRSKRKSTNSN
jgi:hypothetical protein